jgi:competence protein ComEC
MNAQSVAQILNLYFPEPNLSLMKGILFGISIDSSGYFYEQLKKVGLLHLVVASGTNISILIAIVGSFSGHIGKRLSILISIIIIIFYIYLIGPQAPNIRAAFMGILTLVGFMFGRENLAIIGLFLSIIFIGLVYPKWLTSMSLYLSYGATIGMLLFGNIKNSRSWMNKEFVTALSAQIFTTPIIFIYFGQISLISPVANILVSFLIPPLMVMGFITVILGSFNYYLGYLFAMICYGITEYMLIVIRALSNLPGIYFNLHG